MNTAQPRQNLAAQGQRAAAAPRHQPRANARSYSQPAQARPFHATPSSAQRSGRSGAVQRSAPVGGARANTARGGGDGGSGSSTRSVGARR
jgi:hypothetical protein